MKQAYLIRISGRVTGVGFRYSILRWAEELPRLEGYARNAGYGEVEVLLQGPEDQIETMIAHLRQGPPGARIDNFIINRFRRNPGCMALPYVNNITGEQR